MDERSKHRLTAAGLVVTIAMVSLLGGGSLFQAGAAGLVLVAALAGLSWIAGRRSQGTDDRGWHQEMLVVCWVLLSVLPPHKFIGQSSASAVRSAAASSVIELAYFSAVFGVALRVIRERTRHLSSASPPLRFFLLPIWVGVSGLWSIAMPYAIVRGYQFAAIALLGWATVTVVGGRRAAIEDLLGRYMRWFVLIIGALAASGFVVGPVRSQAGADNLDRFGWIGAGPNVVGPLLVTALLFLAVAGEHLRLSPSARLVLGVLFVAGIYSNQSRSSLLGLAVAGGIVLVRTLRRQPRTIFVGAPFAMTAGFIVAVFHWDFVWDYLSRGQSSDRLTSGNGRESLWRIGFESLDGPFDWIAGHGYGITRVLFLEEKSWAGTAHNSLLGLLVGVGLIGVALLLSQYALIIRDLMRSRAVIVSPLMAAIAAVGGAGFFDAFFNDRIAEPSDGYAALTLLGAAVLAWSMSTSQPEDPDPEGNDLATEVETPSELASEASAQRSTQA